MLRARRKTTSQATGKKRAAAAEIASMTTSKRTARGRKGIAASAAPVASPVVTVAEPTFTVTVPPAPPAGFPVLPVVPPAAASASIPGSILVPPIISRCDSINITLPLPVVSASDDIAAHVSTSLREKVKKGDFIGLGHLVINSLPAAESSSKQNIFLVGGELVMQPVHNSAKLLSIEAWTDAFIIYSSIFCSAHLDRWPDLVKYIHTIRLAASRTSTLGWRQYDEQFRLRRAADPTSSWSFIDSELWLLYVHSAFSVTGQSGRSFQSSQVDANQTNKCYAFNYNGQCFKFPCVFQHQCMRCNGSHPFVKCYAAGRGGHQFSNSQRLGVSRPYRHEFSFRQGSGSRPRNPAMQSRQRFRRPVGTSQNSN